ncbi:hypothetical protein MZD04_gp290 [Pseudomonas phage Psa21]|uniref:Uncharacterized protein n=1 Tax=Pseudomonas phage Psa21 TaxID=2530023 RepID=A0A481W4T0_9CAUD|nr:hypothetical protein MZD04_gp290 [Pseudomonas phage Psa21]QBJ02816.1 hypothetical protein PSA21_290 [Pseudomonas phage Psa21]
MGPVYFQLTNNTITFEDLIPVGQNAEGLKFTLVDRYSRKPIDHPMSIKAIDKRHEGVAVSSVVMQGDTESTMQALKAWWNKCEIHEIELEWYHIDSAKVDIRVKGNPKHIMNYALKVETA